MHPSDAFQFTFTNDAATGKAVLTFDYSQSVYDKGLTNVVGGTKDSLKFMDFKLENFGDILGSSTGWSNNGWAETSKVYTYNLNYDWNDLVAMVTADGFDGYIAAHMQSIGAAGKSINEGVFTYVPSAGGNDNSTPEPATLAILGLGLAGLGMARRRMTK